MTQEAQAFREVVELLASEGWTVSRNPTLPELEGVFPDLLATRQGQVLLADIKTREGLQSSSPESQRLADFARSRGWRYEVFSPRRQFTSRERQHVVVPSASETLRAQMHQMSILVDRSKVDMALVLGYQVLSQVVEQLTRRLLDADDPGLDDGYALAAAGVIERQEHHLLRRVHHLYEAYVDEDRKLTADDERAVARLAELGGVLIKVLADVEREQDDATPSG